MKKVIAVLLLIVLYSTGAFAQEYPAKPNTLVNDYTDTLSVFQKQQLEDKLVAFDNSSSSQIAVAIIKSIDDYDINEYARGLANNWGVGSAKKDNGIMILIASQERKISIQIGHGLEGILTNSIVKSIIKDEIIPYFKTGDYYGGLDAGINAIIKYTKDEYKKNNPDVIKTMDQKQSN